MYAKTAFSASLALHFSSTIPKHQALENMARFYRNTDRVKAAEELEKRAAAIRATKQ